MTTTTGCWVLPPVPGSGWSGVALGVAAAGPVGRASPARARLKPRARGRRRDSLESGLTASPGTVVCGSAVMAVHPS